MRSEEKKVHSNAHCRWIIRKDMNALLDLQKIYCKQILSEDQIISILRERNTIGMLTEDIDTDVIKGYMFYELQKQSLLISRFVANIQHPDEFTESLINKLLSKLSFERRRHLKVMVPEDDLPLQLFFRDNGFRCMSIEKNYFDVGLDAYLMQFTLLPNGRTLSEN